MNQKANYYENIKNLLIDNEVYKKIKDYSKNKSDLETYYNVGKELFEADKHYGEGIIKDYSNKLTNEFGKGFSQRNLWLMLRFYELSTKMQTVSAQLTWSHYVELISLDEVNKINYYIKIIEEQNLSVRNLRERIKNKEYERLDDRTKDKLIKKEKENLTDYIKHPIILKSKNNIDEISEKVLKQIILEDIDGFLKELGPGFCYIKNEYKIKMDNTDNYIDLLLFNYIYNCFIVVELKITPLKKEHIGQISIYMNYIDKRLRKISMDKTIGIIICKKETGYVIEYSSDQRIFATSYILK